MAKKHSIPYRLFTRNGIYHAYISFIAETGERVQLRTSTGKISEAEAAKYCLHRIEEIQKKSRAAANGELPGITLDEAFGRYFEERAQFQAKPRNVLLRIANMKKNLGVTYFHEIDKKVLSDYVALRRKTVKNGTINRELSILSAIRNLANDYWEAKTNLANPIKFKLPVPAENIKYLKDWETAQTIIDRAPEHLKPIIFTALHTGFRRGTVLKLKWSQIDFVNNTITVQVKDRTTVGGKNHTIPMIGKLKDLLQTLPRINEYVFNYHGKPVSDIKHAWHSIFYDANGNLKDPKLPYTNFHTLRHTAITWIVKSTGDIRVAQKIAGHADIKTTAIYAHVLDDQKRSALEKTFNQ